MAKVHKSKRKAVDYLYEQDLLSLGKTEPRENYKQLLDILLEPKRVRKGASPNISTVYINQRKDYDIHYVIDKMNVKLIEEFNFYKHLREALYKTLSHYGTTLTAV